MNKKNNILVIKLGALGDFIQALGPMASIRKHHPDASISLLTTKSFKMLGESCGYFDHVIIDQRPKFYEVSKWMKLKKLLNESKFSRIYDLQNNDRTNIYFKLLNSPKPEWVGTAKGCSHRNTDKNRTQGHAFDGHKQTLKIAGINNIELDELKWAQADISDIKIKSPFILLVPGSAPTRLEKRWPSSHYAIVAKKLADAGYQTLILGSKEERPIANIISKDIPGSLDLTGQTSLFQIVELSRKAKLAIGNDTGPMHLIAATSCPCIVLFSGKTYPHKHAPKGEDITVIQEDSLDDLSPDSVIQILINKEII
jgi:ADP-heptose:LPS heptosyltransferase